MKDVKIYMEYYESESKSIAHVITTIHKYYYVQQFMISQGPKEFPEEGPHAITAELNQMNQRICFTAVVVAELARIERAISNESLMLLPRKCSGKKKVRLAYNDKPT